MAISNLDSKKGKFSIMKHLTQEEWMEFLYQELPSERRRQAAQHLEVCAECRTQVEVWRQTMQHLETWNLPEVEASQPGRSLPSRSWKWAAAAAVILATGIAVGRTSAPQPDLTALQQRLEAPLRASLQQQVQADLKQALEAQIRTGQEQVVTELSTQLQRVREQIIAQANGDLEQSLQSLSLRLSSLREEDKRELLATLKEMESQRIADLLAMRKDLETVAVRTAHSLRNAERQLVQLANYTQPITPEKIQP
jgi:hypothetical protein